MRLPVPTNKLVAFTLAGALLTALVAGALALPIGGVTQADGPTTPSATPDASAQLGADAPTPNQGFTPAVQTQSGYEDEHEEDEEEHEAEDEHEDEDDEWE